MLSLLKSADLDFVRSDFLRGAEENGAGTIQLLKMDQVNVRNVWAWLRRVVS